MKASSKHVMIMGIHCLELVIYHIFYWSLNFVFSIIINYYHLIWQSESSYVHKHWLSLAKFVNVTLTLVWHLPERGRWMEGVEIQKVARSRRVSNQGPCGPHSDALAIRPWFQLHVPVQVSVWHGLCTFDWWHHQKRNTHTY